MAKLHTLKATKTTIRIVDDKFVPTGETREYWFFDDASKKITGEPFLEEASAAISALVGRGATHCTLTFSARPFEGWQVLLTKTRHQGSGAWYKTFSDREVWLCKVVKRYFHRRPRRIYVKAMVGWGGVM
jgi:hypothetical protein